MRSLTQHEIETISAGSQFEGWTVPLVAGISSGIAFGAFEAFEQASLVVGLKTFAACSIPTLIVSGLIVGGIEFIQWMNQ